MNMTFFLIEWSEKIYMNILRRMKSSNIKMRCKSLKRYSLQMLFTNDLLIIGKFHNHKISDRNTERLPFLDNFLLITPRVLSLYFGYTSKTKQTNKQNNHKDYFKYSIWAASSEFVSSSIPSWHILTAHAQPFRGARDLAFFYQI